MIQHWFIHCVRCHLYAWMIHRSVLNGLRKKNKTKKPKKNPTRQTFPWKWYCTDWKWVKKQTAHREIQPDCTALGWIRKSMVILALLPQYLTSQILLILNRRTFLHSNTKILWWAYQDKWRLIKWHLQLGSYVYSNKHANNCSNSASVSFIFLTNLLRFLYAFINYHTNS